MSSIPGLEHLEKEGWELVRVGKPIINVDCVVAEDGMPVLIDWVTDRRNWLIIRKIEEPKQYRAFENPAEAEALIGQVLRLKANHKRKSLLIGITLNRFHIGFSRYSLLEAFYCFEKLDGTPFAVEVTS